MGGIVQGFGEYLDSALIQGVRIFTFLMPRTAGRVHEWTLTCIVRWLAWAAFVGVFIALMIRLYIKPPRPYDD